MNGATTLLPHTSSRRAKASVLDECEENYETGLTTKYRRLENFFFVREMSVFHTGRESWELLR